MGIIKVKNSTGSWVEVRDTKLVQEVSKLNTTIGTLNTNINKMKSDIETLKNLVSNLQSQVTQSLAALNEINGEEV